MAIDPNTCGAFFSFDELLRSAIGIGDDGQPILRMVSVADSGDDFLTCGGNPEFNPGSLFSLDSNDKIALRVSIDGL